MNWQSSLRMPLVSLTVAVLSGCETHYYAVDMINYGRSGVLILQVGDERAEGLHEYYSKHGVDFPIIRGMYPKIPSEFRDPTSAFGRFKGYEDKLPDQVEIVWQLAKLSECKYNSPPQSDQTIKWMREQGFDPDAYVNKYGCNWTPLPGKIFHKQLDMQAIRDSEAYREATRLRLDTPFNRHILRVELVFAEDQLTVNTDQYTVNWFK